MVFVKKTVRGKFIVKNYSISQHVVIVETFLSKSIIDNCDDENIPDGINKIQCKIWKKYVMEAAYLKFVRGIIGLMEANIYLSYKQNSIFPLGGHPVDTYI